MVGIALFVYGTLKRGGQYHDLLRGQEFVGPAQTLPRYRLFDGGAFPALVEDLLSGVAVQGEVWRIKDSLLPILDELEEAPILFERQSIALAEGSESVQAYFYRGKVIAWKDCGCTWCSQENRSPGRMEGKTWIDEGLERISGKIIWDNNIGQSRDFPLGQKRLVD